MGIYQWGMELWFLWWKPLSRINIGWDDWVGTGFVDLWFGALMGWLGCLTGWETI